MDMPGPGTVFIRQEWQFTAPVYIDDTITAEATVVDVMPEKSRAKIEFVATTQEGIEVLSGKHTSTRQRRRTNSAGTIASTRPI